MDECCRECTCYGEPDICRCQDIENASARIKELEKCIGILKEDKWVLRRHIAFLERRVAYLSAHNYPTYGYAIWSSNHGMQEEKREKEKVANV